MISGKNEWEGGKGNYEKYELFMYIKFLVKLPIPKDNYMYIQKRIKFGPLEIMGQKRAHQEKQMGRSILNNPVSWTWYNKPTLVVWNIILAVAKHKACLPSPNLQLCYCPIFFFPLSTSLLYFLRAFLALLFKFTSVRNMLRTSASLA